MKSKDWESFPQPILDYMIKYCNLDAEPKPKERQYSVGIRNLIKCLRKAKFQNTVPKKDPKPASSAWNLYFGNLLDREWTPLFPENQVKKTLSIGNGNVITGVLDFVHNDKVWDLKVKFTDLKWVKAPYFEDVVQIASYAIIHGIEDTTALYVNSLGYKVFDVVNNGHLEYALNESNSIKDIDKLKEVLISRAHTYFDNTIPPPEYSDECVYCKYIQECRAIGG